MNEELTQYFVPITSGETDGNGVIVGSILLTAGHVIRPNQVFSYKYQGHWHRLLDENKIVLYDEDIREDGCFNDFAAFRLSDINSPLKLAEELPGGGQIMENISWKHVVKSTPTSGTGLFAQNVIEYLEPHLIKATVREPLGHCIACDMTDPLEPGFSGSALVADTLVYGILHRGSQDDMEGIFQSSISIINLLR